MPCRANLILRQGGEPNETAAQAAAGGPQTHPTPTPDVGAVREPPSPARRRRPADNRPGLMAGTNQAKAEWQVRPAQGYGSRPALDYPRALYPDTGRGFLHSRNRPPSSPRPTRIYAPITSIRYKPTKLHKIKNLHAHIHSGGIVSELVEPSRAGCHHSANRPDSDLPPAYCAATDPTLAPSARLRLPPESS